MQPSQGALCLLSLHPSLFTASPAPILQRLISFSMHFDCNWPLEGSQSLRALGAAFQEATELADLFQRVDAVFASGNYQRIASLLATMRRSLALVGSVPEFQGSKEKLEVYNFINLLRQLPSLPHENSR